MSRNLFAAATLALCVLAAPAVAAQPMPSEPSGVVSLSATATIDVTKDVLAIVWSTTRDGADAGAVQSQLKQALDAALAEARRVAKPGQVDVQTGNFSLYPRYDPKGKMIGWQGSTELQVEGKDMAAIGALAGKIQSMTIARVSQGLSRELREKVEGDLAAQAIQRFRAKAGDYAKSFGYAGYAVRDVNVSATDMPPSAPIAMRARMTAQAADESLSVEPGKGSLSVTVAGSVQMK